MAAGDAAMRDSSSHSTLTQARLALSILSRSEHLNGDHPVVVLGDYLDSLEEQLDAYASALRYIANPDRDPNTWTQTEYGLVIKNMMDRARDALASNPASRCATCGLPDPEKCWCGEVEE